MILLKRQERVSHFSEKCGVVADKLKNMWDLGKTSHRKSACCSDLVFLVAFFAVRFEVYLCKIAVLL